MLVQSISIYVNTDNHNLVRRACDAREGTWGSGIIRCRKPGILAKTELRIPYQRPIRFLPETDYSRVSRSFPRIAGSENEIETTKACGASFYWLHNIKRINLVPRLFPPQEGRAWERGCKRISKFLSRDNLITLIHAFITNRLDYCNSLYYGLPNTELVNSLSREYRMRQPDWLLRFGNMII
jgi:hypothetical protein